MVRLEAAPTFSPGDAPAQFKELIEALPLPRLAGQESECCAWLNHIGEVALRDRLQEKQRPSWAEVHKALAEVRCRACVVLECAANLMPLPEWRAEEAQLHLNAR
ncbi:hypothetical protein [Bradyrhizobium sp. RDM4]|uniref:hypothetical protein n=1 Tax=Bradyrhizobium sp. RDM4 TaxID=3378765 RepID=UPI0038FCDC61